MAVEELKYALIAKYDQFEIRQYAPYVVAETTVSGKFERVGNVAFRGLAGYIFGKNRRKDSIAMTAPVIQEAKAEKIAMTAPSSTPNSKALPNHFSVFRYNRTIPGVNGYARTGPMWPQFVFVVLLFVTASVPSKLQLFHQLIHWKFLTL